VRALVAVLAVALLAGCGGSGTPPTAAEWTANAHGVIAQLRGDIVEISGADRAAQARGALRDDSELYGLLVSFSDIGGCDHMRAALGTAPPGRVAVTGHLAKACAHLRRAATLFTEAVARKSAALLAAAARSALAGLPELERSALALRVTGLTQTG
jgi:hypothetical protein